MAVELSDLKRLVDHRINRAFHETTITGSGAIMVTGTPGDYTVSLDPAASRTAPPDPDPEKNITRIPFWKVITESGVKKLVCQYGATDKGVWTLGSGGANMNTPNSFKATLGSGLRIYGKIEYDITTTTAPSILPWLGTYDIHAEVKVTAMTVLNAGTYTTPPTSSTKTILYPGIGLVAVVAAGSYTDYYFIVRVNSDGAEDPLSAAEWAADVAALGPSPWRGGSTQPVDPTTGLLV